MPEYPLRAECVSADTLGAARQPQVALNVAAGIIPASTIALARFQEQVGDMLARGLPLSVTITDLENQRDSPARFRELCSAIAACARRHSTPPASIEIVVAAGAMMPARAWAIRAEELERGPLYLLASDSELCMRTTDRVRFRNFWQELWQLRGERNLRFFCAPWVRSCCPLLAHEAATTVLPRSAIQVSPSSAWVVQPIDLLQYAASSGALDTAQLQAALYNSIEHGLALHSRIDWPTAGLRHDSWLNRRLAVFITGIGDLVVRRRENPQDLDCLVSLRRLLQWIQSTLARHSRHLATAEELLPAIGQFDPAKKFCNDRERWESRWSAAIREHASACRNLLVMSPWSVFPALSRAGPGYLNLLPLLGFADACAFPESPRLHGWNIKDFMQLYQHTRAVLEGGRGTQLFAEGV